MDMKIENTVFAATNVQVGNTISPRHGIMVVFDDTRLVDEPARVARTVARIYSAQILTDCRCVKYIVIGWKLLRDVLQYACEIGHAQRPTVWEDGQVL